MAFVFYHMEASVHKEGFRLCWPVAGVEVRLEGTVLVRGLSW